jgi:hypothetical protein
VHTLDADRHGTPDEHDCGQEDGRGRAREHHVARNFPELTC